MKGVIIATIVILSVSAWVYFSKVGEQEQSTRVPVSPTLITPEKPIPADIEQEMMFIPYWNIPSSGETSGYDSLIYFGVAPERDGYFKEDTGLSNVGRFIERTSSTKKRYITVRMLDTETNIEILEHPEAQVNLIREITEIAKEYDFDGVVLDLEMSVIPFSETREDISDFVERVSGSIRKENLELLITLYGDTFYRGRPYDVSFLGKQVDGILIMAYDFHKSRGEPGPNFPFDRKEEYDFKQMVEDFSKNVDTEKITVIFGMYGYDWTLGEQGLPLKSAQAIPLHEIESDILPGCTGDCKVSTDNISSETKVTYSDSVGYDHVLWFESEDSVWVKRKYLEELGIGSIGYWVWGYF